MDRYKISPFKEVSNKILEQQSSYTLYIPESDLTMKISGDEMGNICGYDTLKEITHVEDERLYLALKKYFIIGEELKVIVHLMDSLDFLRDLFDDEYSFRYLIVVFNYAIDIFDEQDLEDLSRYDSMNRYEGHIKFCRDSVRLKSNNIIGTVLKVEYLKSELEDLV